MKKLPLNFLEPLKMLWEFRRSYQKNVDVSDSAWLINLGGACGMGHETDGGGAGCPGTRRRHCAAAADRGVAVDDEIALGAQRVVAVALQAHVGLRAEHDLALGVLQPHVGAGDPRGKGAALELPRCGGGFARGVVVGDRKVVAFAIAGRVLT